MTSVAVWVSSDEARIFHFKTTGIESQHLYRHGKKHPAETHGKNHGKHGSDTDHFLGEVADALIKTGAGTWLLVGPGLAKTHLKTHVEEHHSLSAKKIVGVESMDKATDGEIRDFAHEYFKQKNAYL